MLEELFNSKRGELDRSHVQVSQTGFWKHLDRNQSNRKIISVGGQQGQGVDLVTGIVLLPPFELSRSPTGHATKTNSLAEGCITPSRDPADAPEGQNRISHRPNSASAILPTHSIRQVLQTAFRDHNHSNRKSLRVSRAHPLSLAWQTQTAGDLPS
ncbi:hypothetical protein FB45DRAFT_900338 [Roridomyces roridus]|uniref:Uncharacterized protein n=1 Tax=Roridomyces roridus TaxID=1738132 RepID=A0AAD7C7L5_9AGAR|nr:hypothetical protein FB45DRAFT_900338 [Roridomyces roridus]